MDIKTLFHSPDSLSDADLQNLENKIAFQRLSRTLCAAFFGIAVSLGDTVFLKRAFCYKRAGLAGLIGYGFGMYAVYTPHLAHSGLHKDFDQDILVAHDQRFARTVLNATGFGSSYVSTKDYSMNPGLKKPYWANVATIARCNKS